MATIQVQVGIPEELVQEIDKWVSKGRFASRSDAVKSIISFYQERERTISFYNMLTQRSKEARKRGKLIPLEELDVKRNTMKLLEELKRKYAAKSIDETVKRLTSKAEKIPDSMLGAHPKMKPFTRQEAKFDNSARG